jgi:hypothetical protein
MVLSHFSTCHRNYYPAYSMLPPYSLTFSSSLKLTRLRYEDCVANDMGYAFDANGVTRKGLDGKVSRIGFYGTP